MSETDTDETLEDAEFDEEAESEPAEPPRLAQAEKPAKPARKRGIASVAWLALFLALIGVTGLGYLTVEKFRSESLADQSNQDIAALRSRISALDAGIADLEGSIRDLESTDSGTRSALTALQQDFDQRVELIDSLPPRMSGMERSVAALQGVSIDARNTYLIAEAEYYMQIANAQLQLAGNPYLASLALGQADDRLLQLADPALTDVRRSIADELAALDVMEKPDIAGVTLMLGSLSRVVDSLPIRSASGMRPEAAEEQTEESGVSRIWQGIKGAASSLVRVTPPDSDQVALITPQFADLARANLALQLQAARLALLRGEQEAFEQSLDDADAWLELYFDSSSEQVAGTRRSLADMRSEYSDVATPDISESLRLLRQYKALSESVE